VQQEWFAKDPDNMVFFPAISLSKCANMEIGFSAFQAG